MKDFETIGKDEKYRLPANYFEELTPRTMVRIAAQRKARLQRSLWTWASASLGAAAIFAAVALIPWTQQTQIHPTSALTAQTQTPPTLQEALQDMPDYELEALATSYAEDSFYEE